MRLTIVSTQVGLPKLRGEAQAADPMDKQWESAIFKERVAGSIRASKLGLEGDGQADLVNHGGVDKAINLYPREHYPYWLDDLARPDFSAGAFGENFTTAGAVEEEVCIGDVFEAEGGAIFQISQPREPCWKLARRWRVKDLALRVLQTGKTGWYFRVLAEGHVEAGMPLRLAGRPHPEWTVTAANEVMHHRKEDRAAAATLAACPVLSESWRVSLGRRVAAAGLD